MEHPPPDTKDWSTVLSGPCEQCGLEVSNLEREALAASIRANAASWRSTLKRGEMIHQRPPVSAGQPPRWSALEYACHVRDVYEVFNDRLTKMVKGKAPTFANWDQNHAAIEGGYADQDPEKLSYALAVNAGKVADLLDRVRDAKWNNTGTRADGVEFTIDSMARYLLHDVSHHIWDVNQGFDAIKEQRKRLAKQKSEQDRAQNGDSAQ